MQPVDTTHSSTDTQLVWETCRTQHQTWAKTLAYSEQEIDQLLSLLAELPDENYRSLRQHTIDYAQALNRLKDRIHRVRLDIVCPCADCSVITPPMPCPDPHFVPPPAGNSLISGVWTEYDRLKDRCHAFLGELMRLNII